MQHVGQFGLAVSLESVVGPLVEVEIVPTHSTIEVRDTGGDDDPRSRSSISWALHGVAILGRCSYNDRLYRDGHKLISNCKIVSVDLGVS